MAYAFGQSGSREAIGGDDQGGVEDETDPASATGEDQREHDNAGEASEVSNGEQTLRSFQNCVGELGQAAQSQTEPELRAGGEAINAQAKPLSPCPTVQESGQMRRHLNTLLGRVIRDNQRKCTEPDSKLKEELKQAQRIYDQQRKDKGKVYSVHAPEVECISKGKAQKRYEYGVKVSVGTSSRGGWNVAAQAHSGNPYDGRTLKETLEQVRRMVGKK
jgi:hypothetical protein